MKIFFLCLGFLAGTNTAMAACGTLSLTGIAGPTVNWTESFSSQQLNFTFNRTSNGACTALATFSKGGGSSYATRRVVNTVNSSKTLLYQLHKTSGLSATQILKQPPDVGSTNEEVQPSSAFSGSVSSRAASYYISIPTSTSLSPTIVRAGTYTDTFTVRAYDGANIDNSYNVTLTVNVPVVARISLVSTGSPFNAADTSETLNFGNLVTNQTMSFDMRILTNSGYDVRFSSANDGVMKHLTPGVTTTVPYTVTVNGIEQSLVGTAGTPLLVVSGSGESSTSGFNQPVTVKIGNVSSKVAGNYSDVITVTTVTQ